MVLMYFLVQIDLPPYTDYASLEQKLTLAVEYVSVPIHCFMFIYPIASAGRPLDLVKNRGYPAYLDGPCPFQVPTLCCTGGSSPLSYLLRLLPVLASSPISVL